MVVVFNRLSFHITHSSSFIQPQTLGHSVVYLSLPHFTLQLFLVSGDIATGKTCDFSQMVGNCIL